MAEGRLQRTREAYRTADSDIFRWKAYGPRKDGTIGSETADNPVIEYVEWNVIEADFDTACDHGDENDTPWAI
jgi:hypothetical protein